MSSWKIILSTLVIFMAGALTGGLLVSVGFNLDPVRKNSTVIPAPATITNSSVVVSSNANPSPVAGLGGVMNPWLARERELMRRMDREMNLTPEQHKHIETIISISQERTRDLWKPIAPAMNKEFNLLRKEIRDQLTPEQQDKYDALLKPRLNPNRKPAPAGTNSDAQTKPAAD